MSDFDLERRIAAALRSPVAKSDDARDRIMARVRGAALAGAPRRRSLQFVPRAARHSIVGLAIAASIGSVAVLSVATPDAIVGAGLRPGVVADTPAAMLRDTLRLIRLIRDDDRRYAFAVDGARWAPDPSTTPVRSGERLVSLLHVARDSN